jgi:hypothetical protein
MLSVVIVADRDERKLVTTLATLVSGAAAGLVSEVLLVEARRESDEADATIARVADVAGCRLIAVNGSPDEARRAGLAAARFSWLLLLDPGSVPDNGWINEIVQFAERGIEGQGAVFRHARSPYRRAGVTDMLQTMARVMFGPRANQGLLVSRQTYESAMQGLSRNLSTQALLSRIGRRNLVTLRTRLFVD